MACADELVGLVRLYGCVRLNYLEDQLMWLAGGAAEVDELVRELVERKVLCMPEPGLVKAG